MVTKILEIPRNRVKMFIARVQTIFVFVLSLFFGPVLLASIVPMYLTRLLVFKFAPRVRPDLGKMVSSRSALFASDDIYNRPLCTVVGKYVTEGTLNFGRTREIILKNWINFKHANGTPVFPELTQYVSYWMGFAFWKKEKKFRIGDHFKLYSSPDPVTESKLTEFMSELSLRPWAKDRSPWEMIIVPRFIPGGIDDGEPKSATIFRWHHTLTDGFGVFNLIQGISTLELTAVTKPKTNGDTNKELRKNACTTLIERFIFMIRAPYDVIKYSLEIVDPIKSHSWHVPEKELNHQWNFALAEDLIPVQLIKEIKNQYGVSFTAVLMAGIAGALRSFMATHPSKKIPDFIHAGVPFPLSGHPGKLRNFWTVTTVKLPVGEKSPLKRLQYIERKLKQIKGSTAPMTIFLFMPLVGSCFNWMIRSLFKNKSTGIMISSMPGAESPIVFFERNCLYTDFFVALGPGNTGIGFSACSYNGIVRVGVTADTAMTLQPKQVQGISNNVVDQLVILKELAQEIQV